MIPRFKPWLDWKEFLALFRRNRGAVEKFEREFASAFDTIEAVAFPYGRSALWAFLQAMDISDAEIIMPAYTCSVVAHAISLSGNHPRFVDISLSDYNMDLDLLPSAINEKTRAIIATHLFGYPLDLDRLENIVAQAETKYGHKIWLIQDCAHSFGASWKGRLVGNSGDTALYAFNVSKMMTSIFGGMLTFRDPELAEKVRTWRNKQFRTPGWTKGMWRRFYLLAIYVAFSKPIYSFTWWLQNKTTFLKRFTDSYHLDDKIHFPPDYDEKMLDIEAAVGLEQLKKYPEIISRRRANATYYSTYLPQNTAAILPPLVSGATYSHYVVLVPDRTTCIADMANSGIEAGELIQYSVPKLAPYKHLTDACPNAEYASHHTINIPVFERINTSIFQ